MNGSCAASVVLGVDMSVVVCMCCWKMFMVNVTSF